VTSLGVPEATERGICFGTTAAPLTNCNPDWTIDTSPFTQGLYDLTPGTLYYFRGYATNADGTVYSDDLTFTTNTPPTIQSLSPADDSTNVPVDTNLAITFSEAVLDGTGSAGG